MANTNIRSRPEGSSTHDAARHGTVTVTDTLPSSFQLVGYTGTFISWRGAFLAGGAGVLVVVLLSLRALPLGAPPRLAPASSACSRAPLTLVLAGGFILFV